MPRPVRRAPRARRCVHGDRRDHAGDGDDDRDACGRCVAGPDDERAVAVSATQTASTSTKADANAAGGTSAIGLALALGDRRRPVTAGTDRNVTAGGAVSFTAAGSSANATRGDRERQGCRGQEGLDRTAARTTRARTSTRRRTTSSGNANTQRAKTPKTTTTPDAKSGENGGTKVTVAGAVAINVIDTVSRASIADGVSVTSTGSVSASQQREHRRDREGRRQGRRHGGRDAGDRRRGGDRPGDDRRRGVHRDERGRELARTDAGGDDARRFRRSEARAAGGRDLGAGGGKVSIAGSLALTIADVRRRPR